MFEFELQAISLGDATSNTKFSFDLVVPDEFKAIVDKSLVISPLNVVLILQMNLWYII